MAGKFRLLIFAIAGLSATALAQDAAPEKADDAGKKLRRRGPMSPELENVRKAIDALSPEQLKRFQENFLRWANLPPETKKSLRDRDDFRRKRMAEDIEAAIRESGLTLDKERSEHFAQRYVEERRTIEEQLRKEMNEKRQPLVKEIIARLKTEFAAPIAPVAAP